MGLYAKAIAAFLGGIATWGATAALDDSISLGEWFGVLGVLGTALAVFAVPNKAENEGGQVTTASIIVTVAICIIVFLIMWVLFIR